MRKLTMGLFGLAALGLAGTAYAAIDGYIQAALDDPSRPAADKARDADRKAGEIVALTGIKPGENVADVFPGGGYYTRIFAKIVGPKGHVYGVVPGDLTERGFHPSDMVKKLAAEPGYENVSAAVDPLTTWAPSPKLDLIFISQFYHDMHNPGFGGPDIAAEDRGMFNALKPGGILFIIDHSAPAGSGTSDTATTHRIDEAAAKSELKAAGFRLVAESDVLRNPNDPRTKLVFDPSIRGHTDQFVLKYQRPK
ncbi:MAG TPA: methyltransferase [Caulobacteraceae bacterium]|nr:methyltransferase [Caulobacteraceae bacterium]